MLVVEDVRQTSMWIWRERSGAKLSSTSRAPNALRPAVVTRKVCDGNRSARGAQTQEVLAASMLLAIQQRDFDAAVILPQR